MLPALLFKLRRLLLQSVVIFLLSLCNVDFVFTEQPAQSKIKLFVFAVPSAAVAVTVTVTSLPVAVNAPIEIPFEVPVNESL